MIMMLHDYDYDYDCKMFMRSDYDYDYDYGKMCNRLQSITIAIIISPRPGLQIYILSTKTEMRMVACYGCKNIFLPVERVLNSIHEGERIKL
jgi:hypothetical protein